MSCSDIPSLLDLQNTKKHADDFGRLMGTSEGYSTNEVTGQVRPTYNKVIADLGFKPGTGDFTTGFTVQPGQRDYAWFDPVSKNWYSWLGIIPVSGHVVVPETNPVGDVNWKPVTDQILREDLSQQTGSSLVGFGQAGTGAVHRTAQDKMCERVTPKDFGAIGDGTLHLLSERFTTLALAQATYPHVTSLTQTIDWAAFQAAFNTNAVTIDYRSGNYVLNTDLYRNKPTQLIGDAVSKIKMVNGSKLLIEGALVALPKLSANVTMTSRSLTFVGTPALSAGDSIVLYNPTDFSWSLHRSYYREGEFFKIFGVTGNVADIYGLPSDVYTASAMDVYRIDGVTVTLDNVVVEGESTLVGAPIVVRFGVNVVVNSFKGRQSSSYQLELDRCFGVDVFGGSAVNNSPYTDDEYGIIISNCTDVVVHGGSHFATRHSIALGGGAGVGAIPCRNIKIIGANLMNSGTDIGAADMHGNCDNVQYINCEINSHANMSGRDSKYINCRIHQRTSPSDGCCIYGSEVIGGTYEIIDCELITQGDLDSFGAITLTMVQPLKQDLTVKVRNLTLRGGNGGAFGKIVRVSPVDGETKKTNVDIRGVRCDIAQMLCVAHIRCDNNPSFSVPSNGHIVDDIYGPVGMALIQDTGAAIAGVPTRQMRQGGYVDATTSVTTAVIAAPTSFRYKYSKMPTVTLGVSSPNGSTTSTIGGQPASPVAYLLSESQIMAGIVTPANMTAGADVRLHWSAGISEI